MLNQLKLYLALGALVLISTTSPLSAQYRDDFWNRAQDFYGGLDIVHTNNCTPGTEAFVSISNSNPSYGFCIETSARAAANWQTARQTCFDLGKRLPEPFEWKRACDNASSLGVNGMLATNLGEWSSNKPLQLAATNCPVVPLMGHNFFGGANNQACDTIGRGLILRCTDNDSVGGSLTLANPAVTAYRCVR